MKTFHVGGVNPVRRYSSLEAALKQAKDDDIIELHKNITFAGKLSYNLIIEGNGHTLTVKGDLIQSAGKMDIDGGTLNVEGDYRLQSVETDSAGKKSYGECDAHIVSKVTDSEINVDGDFVTQSTTAHNAFTPTQYLYFGTMRIKGNFTQMEAGGTKNNFMAYPNFQVIFCGNNKQEIFFENPGESYFSYPVFENSPDNIVFKSKVRGWTLQQDYRTLKDASAYHHACTSK